MLKLIVQILYTSDDVNKSKYLTQVPTNESKEKVLCEKYMKIKLN